MLTIELLRIVPILVLLFLSSCRTTTIHRNNPMGIPLNQTVYEMKNCKSRTSRLDSAANSCLRRQSPGPLCETCELMSLCVKNSNGWFGIPLVSCDVKNGYYCNARLGVCSKDLGPCHPLATADNFKSNLPGIFPDPYDCQRYYLCYYEGSTLTCVIANCDVSKAFDASTGQCSVSPQSAACTQKQFECPYVGHIAAWPTNPNIYYVCKATVKQNINDTIIIYPLLQRCSDGQIFVDSFCRDSSLSRRLAPAKSTTRPDRPNCVLGSC
ncbi:uncharacterized protein LOC115632670 [Scaptodrosophila lebanonensis]|uniref:Uncharacterized protein LOC115632667 n=1 Tax=Drosophila lebanonensis TaxID=7225 RepID=A0A6J2UBM3_DROLE|nr:uncharacterized protein LOC115632667 [Scaptodrosophila lebanonensis]XP_030385764.1 uncharacterized protein LOC115632670 [Scaptodrosophila lebanonensis]